MLSRAIIVPFPTDCGGITGTNARQHESARQFLVDLGRKITARSGEDREGSFLFQRISVLLHRFNSVLLHDSFVSVHCPD